MLRPLLLALSKDAAAQGFVTRSRVFRPSVQRFVAGEELEDGIQAVKALNARGMMAALDYLGESTITEADARRAADAYAQVLNAIHARELNANISLKASQIGLDLSLDLAAALLREITMRAAEIGVFVGMDMEDSGRLPATLHLVDRVLEAGARHVGVALQAYLYRTPTDVERLLARGVTIRLCKGAYREPQNVALPRKRDVDRQFVHLTERLLQSGVYAAIATHDERLIAAAAAYAKSRGVHADRFEFQLLYGIRRDLQERLVREGFRVRIYVPFGAQWYPYFMRRLAERPANLLFLARNILRP